MSDELSKHETLEEMRTRLAAAIAAAGVATETQMREADVPTPATTQELGDYIAGLVNRPHDYGTCVYALSMAACAAMRHVAHCLGVTGFQMSMAQLDVIRRERRLKHGFMVVDAEKLLYPQYDVLGDVRRFLAEQWAELRPAAEAKLAEVVEAHPAVRNRWKQIASGDPYSETVEVRHE